jgi:hypothetical protein
MKRTNERVYSVREEEEAQGRRKVDEGSRETRPRHEGWILDFG